MDKMAEMLKKHRLDFVRGNEPSVGLSAELYSADILKMYQRMSNPFNLSIWGGLWCLIRTLAKVASRSNTMTKI